MGLLPLEIAAHYDEGAERDRLTGGGRLEHLRTRELLARWLPPAPADILDVGGAAGVYALPLAREGYGVRLVDPLPLHAQQAWEGSAAQPHRPLIAADLGAARALEAADRSVDAVLLLGPLYHLIEEGPAWLLPDLEARLDDPDRRERLLRAIRRTEREPSFAGATSHLLAVGRRPQ